MKTPLLTWLKDQQEKLDMIIKSSAEDFYKSNVDKENFEFDLQECQLESFNLVGGNDLCYDRPNTPFVYSMWYHARRINTFLSFFADTLLKNTSNDKIEIFDLGAGTGAVQWSIALILCGMKALGIKTPKVTVINVDSSPFMLKYGEDFLWKHFLINYPEISSLQFEAKYSVNSWQNPDNVTLSNPWIVSSYLFDMSDNEEEIAKSFWELIDSFQPSQLLLITSDQTKKKLFLSTIESTLKQKNFILTGRYSSNNNSLVFDGTLKVTSKFRDDLSKKISAKGLSNAANWKDTSFIGMSFSKFQTTLALDTPLKLYTVSEKNRNKIKMTHDQIEASKHSDRPTIITGPAGCGKSVILTERIKNYIEINNYDPNLKILVTTFNKDLIQYLGDWIEQLLGDKAKRTHNPKEKISYFKFSNSNRNANIYVLHFDVLPTRLTLNIKIPINHKLIGDKFMGDLEDYHINKLTELASERLVNENHDLNSFEKIANGEFLFEEYHRIVYGFQCIKHVQYSEIERKGRGNSPRLNRKSTKRKFIWDVITEYTKFLKDNKIDSFTLRRFRLLQNIKKNGFPDKFDFVFVDEFQDCTDADFEIFYNILKDKNRIVLTGDLAQSVHLGKSSTIPNQTGMGYFDRRNKLQGSFRLPYRISEAISNISEEINRARSGLDEGDIINPFRGSPPGARPIIVYAKTFGQAVSKIKNLFITYKVYDFESITIFEKDDELKEKLKGALLPVYSETILKAKGMEKPCVLWSTRKKVDSEKEVFEYVYTILTRTSALLIILISDSTLSIYYDILKCLNRERIIFYDSDSKQKFLGMINQKTIEIIDDVEDDSELIDNSEDTEISI